MSYDIFLKIDGIDGESMDDKHKNEIEVLSWRWNIHQESTMHAGSGLGSGKVSVTNLSFEHYNRSRQPEPVQILRLRQTHSESRADHAQSRRQPTGIPQIQFY